MVRFLFEDKRSALVFAGLVVVATLMLVSPRDGGTVVDATVDQIETRRAANAAQQQSAADTPETVEVTERDVDQAAKTDPIFDDYEAEDSSAQSGEAGPSSFAAAPGMAVQGRPFRPEGPIGGPVKADGPGIAVPHSDDAREAAASRQIPVAVVRPPKS